MKKAIVFAAAAVLMSTNAMAERSGQDVYTTKCAVCHASGVAGAPKLGDAAAWAPRAATGADALLAVAKSGKGAMPPKGLCMDCSDSELQSAIQYMLDNSK